MAGYLKIECCEPKKEEEAKKKTFGWGHVVVILTAVLFFTLAFEAVFAAPLAQTVYRAVCSVVCPTSASTPRTEARRNGNRNRNGNGNGNAQTASARRLLDGIKRAAKERNYACVTRRQPVSVYVGVRNDGWIAFSVRRGDVKWEVHPNYNGLWEPEVKQREAELRRIGRQLLARGRRVARPG